MANDATWKRNRPVSRIGTSYAIEDCIKVKDMRKRREIHGLRDHRGGAMPMVEAGVREAIDACWVSRRSHRALAVM